MIECEEQYLVDESGNRKAVLVSISQWMRIIEDLEELDDIRAYDRAKAEPSETIPFEQAVSEIKGGAVD
ncbi:MAG: hypothetical protein AB7W37_16340 [Syntrophobacteraceae bacterium]|jgi:hypothetical protein